MHIVNLLRGKLRPAQPSSGEPWLIDSLHIDRTGDAVRLEMSGWALPDPELGVRSPAAFSINGAPFSEVQYPIDREDVGKVLWHRKNARYSGFQCIAVGQYDFIYKDGGIELTYVNPRHPPQVAAQQSWFIRDPLRESPVPEESRRFRVIGSTDLQPFLLGGFTDFKRLEAAVRILGGKPLTGCPRILDWGCGCGRIARYMSGLPEIFFAGCDIDKDNIDWCTEHLNGTFTTTRACPPLPFAAASFDLVYGVSVFTHMRERLQDAWLAELNRITAPGALILMTIHGQTALDYAGLNPQDRETLARKIATDGVHVTGRNSQIEGYAEDESEYVNVFHDLRYVWRHWGQYFEIITILPGYLYTHDLVAMRKRT
jgi:SAM-dependent methyltransferase